jgi:hypothetical protein
MTQGAAQPLVSTLNAIDGAITSNLAIVPAANGSISIFGSNPTHLVMDDLGIFHGVVAKTESLAANLANKHEFKKSRFVRFAISLRYLLP